MSYASRVYRQRNPRSEEKSKDSFFGNQHEANKARSGKSFFQAKLEVNKPGDQFEKEADAAANAVVNKSNSKPLLQQKKISGIQRLSTPTEDERLGTNESRMEKDKEVQTKLIQKANAEPEEKKDQKIKPPDMEKEKKKKTPVQTKQESGAGQASTKLSSRLENNWGSGKKLPANTLNEMGSSFGADFSEVRIHNDNEAAELNREINAQAFTHGKDIYFNEGKYKPETSSGKELLAHELTHTVQQTGTTQLNKKPAGIQRKDPPKEERNLQSKRFAGDPDLENALDGKKNIKFGAVGEHVKKLQQAMIDSGIEMPISTRKTGSPDGIFLSETLGAVKTFQKNCGLESKDVDGIVGPITMELFDARFPAGPAAPVPTTKKTVTVNITVLNGSKMVPSRALAFANTIYLNQANIEIIKGTERKLDRTETENLIGKDLMLEEHFFDNFPSDEEKVLFKVNQSAGAISMYFVKDITDSGKLSEEAVAYAITAKNKMGFLGFAVGNRSGNNTFAHELGHVLGVENHTTTKDPKTDETLLMAAGAPGFRLTAEDIKTIRGSSFAK
jgi:peptidoglycan hydrolase-like protein with peptidoglycan-binding domain